MRIGCIAVGEIVCDNCHRTIKHPQRYLVVGDDDDTTKSYCIGCCEEKGYAQKKAEKGKNEILTFFTEEKLA